MTDPWAGLPPQAAFVRQLASKYDLPLGGRAGQAASPGQQGDLQQTGSGSAAAAAAAEQELSEAGSQAGSGADDALDDQPQGDDTADSSSGIVTFGTQDARWFITNGFSARMRVER